MMKKGTIKHAFTKTGLILFNPKIILEKMDKIKGPKKRHHISRRLHTPKPDDSDSDPIDQTCALTPYTSLAAIAVYDEQIDKRLTSACDNTIPLTPSVSHMIEKHNKAQNIIVLQSVLSYEELEKRKLKRRGK